MYGMERGLQALVWGRERTAGLGMGWRGGSIMLPYT